MKTKIILFLIILLMGLGFYTYVNYEKTSVLRDQIARLESNIDDCKQENEILTLTNASLSNEIKELAKKNDIKPKTITKVERVETRVEIHDTVWLTEKIPVVKPIDTLVITPNHILYLKLDSSSVAVGVTAETDIVIYGYKKKVSKCLFSKKRTTYKAVSSNPEVIIGDTRYIEVKNK